MPRLAEYIADGPASGAVGKLLGGIIKCSGIPCVGSNQTLNLLTFDNVADFTDPTSVRLPRAFLHLHQHSLNARGASPVCVWQVIHSITASIADTGIGTAAICRASFPGRRCALSTTMPSTRTRTVSCSVHLKSLLSQPLTDWRYYYCPWFGKRVWQEGTQWLLRDLRALRLYHNHAFSSPAYNDRPMFGNDAGMLLWACA